MVCALFGFVIAAEIDPDEPSPVTACDDRPTLRAIEIFLLARKKTHTFRTRTNHERGHSSVDWENDGLSAVSRPASVEPWRRNPERLIVQRLIWLLQQLGSDEVLLRIELGAVFAISFWPIVVLRGHRTPDSGVASSQWNPTLPVPNRKMDASLSATISLSLLFIELWHFGVDMPAQPVLVPTKLSQRTRAVSTMLLRPRPLVACRRREVSRKSIHLGDVFEPS